MPVVEDVLDQQPNHTSLKVAKPLRGPEIMMDAKKDAREPGARSRFLWQRPWRFYRLVTLE